MDWKQYVSAAALLVSIVSFGFTFGLANKSAVVALRPVLVFEYTDQDGWSLRNIGNGPALNVLVALKHEGADWLDPVRIPPLQKDGKIKLTWLDHSNVRTLGASYVDISERVYSSTCTNDLSLVYESNVLKTWPESEIAAYWKASAASSVEHD